MSEQEIDHHIHGEIETAKPDSEIAGVRDTNELVRMVAYFRHRGDVKVNQRATLTAKDNWEFAKQAVYKWAVAYDKANPFPTLQGAVHEELQKIAYKKWTHDLGRESSGHYWHKAKESLATRVLILILKEIAPDRKC